MSAVANGYWCATCEFFEDAESTEMEDGRCLSCGCPVSAHKSAVVIA